MLKLSRHESGLFPFNVSNRKGQRGDGCVGPFQLENKTAQSFKVNPFNNDQATLGAIKLMNQNYQILKNKLSATWSGLSSDEQFICVVLAHNHGWKKVRKALQRSSGSFDDKIGSIVGSNGNPSGKKFYEQVIAEDVSTFI